MSLDFAILSERKFLSSAVKVCIDHMDGLIHIAEDGTNRGAVYWAGVRNVDCIVIGGGPAGLTAAVYLSRFRRDVLLVDAGNSRAKLIPESHNYPGFIGISGVDLLLQLQKQSQLYGADCRKANVTELVHDKGSFKATIDNQEITARTILLCTGVVDHKPDIQVDDPTHFDRIRYCPVCDGYEGINKRLGVMGNGGAALKKARFLRTYSNDVFLFGSHTEESSQPDGDEALNERIHFRPYPTKVVVDETGVQVFTGNEVTRLEALYPALGCRVRSELGSRLGAVTSR